MCSEHYVVAWQSRASGASGRDEKTMTREDCKVQCDRLNDELPGYFHYPCKPSSAPQSAKATGPTERAMTGGRGPFKAVLNVPRFVIKKGTNGGQAVDLIGKMLSAKPR